ncbi:MAG: putative monooxygenase [Dactylosporangium sp.]|nr:putative monooxygenase [Dactylosporangium sp.]
MTDREVIVVGAGPVGLWLACELRIAGVDTLILEREQVRSPHPKALGIHARTIEVLAMRGMQEQFLAEGVKMPRWHFGMLEEKLDFTKLDTPYPFVLSFPQPRTEAILEDRALELGAEILRGQQVTGLAQDDSSVTVEVAGGRTFSGRYVVGADGAGSTVRHAAGIGYPGTDATVFAYLGDVVLDSPPPPGLVVHNEHGALITAPIPGGFFRVTGYDAANQEPGRREVTMDELRSMAIRIAGTDFGMRDPSWLTRFGNATRQAETYRNGRVLLAGDAAHMHFPAGGVGLNVGLQDAMNLGWKLAAEVQGRAAEGLLDSYHGERYPLGAELAEHTLAQTALITATSAEGQALRSLFGKLIVTQPSVSLELARKLSALDVSYPPADVDAHPLVGTRVAEAGEFLLDGHAIVLNLSGKPLASASEYARKMGIGTFSGTFALSDARAAIIRPDGHVWWATGESQVDTATRLALAELDAAF